MLALVAAFALQAAAPAELPPLHALEVVFDIVKAETVQRYYPARAQTLGKQGKAEINCLIAPGGELTDCRVVSETPEGFEFGAAAVNMRVLFKARPIGKSGQPVIGRRVILTINFNLS